MPKILSAPPRHAGLAIHLEAIASGSFQVHPSKPQLQFFSKRPLIPDT